MLTLPLPGSGYTTCLGLWIMCVTNVYVTVFMFLLAGGLSNKNYVHAVVCRGIRNYVHMRRHQMSHYKKNHHYIGI